jgi:hypothetical protein
VLCRPSGSVRQIKFVLESSPGSCLALFLAQIVPVAVLLVGLWRVWCSSRTGQSL